MAGVIAHIPNPTFDDSVAGRVRRRSGRRTLDRARRRVLVARNVWMALTRVRRRRHRSDRGRARDDERLPPAPLPYRVRRRHPPRAGAWTDVLWRHRRWIGGHGRRPRPADRRGGPGSRSRAPAAQRDPRADPRRPRHPAARSTCPSQRFRSSWPAAATRCCGPREWSPTASCCGRSPTATSNARSTSCSKGPATGRRRPS